MTKLRIGGVPEHFNLPWHLCLDNDEFSEVGLDITWRDFYGGTGQMSKALRDNEIDVAIMLTEGIVKDIIDGNPSKIIQKYIASPLIWGIHVAQNSKYTTIADLKDTTCAISRFGSGSHLLAYVNAQNMDWDTSELKFEVVKNLNGALEALPEDKAQYFMWEHFTTKPYVDNGTFRRVGDCPTPWPCFVIVARDEVIKNNTKDLEALLDVINRTSKEFKNIPMISKTLSNAYEQDEKDIKEWLGLTRWSQEQLSETTITNVQDKLLELELISEKIDYNSICHTFK